MGVRTGSALVPQLCVPLAAIQGVVCRNTCKNYQYSFFFFSQPVPTAPEVSVPASATFDALSFLLYCLQTFTLSHCTAKKKRKHILHFLKSCDTRATQAFQWSLRVTFSELFDYMFRILCGDAFRLSLKWSAYLESGATHLRIIGQALDSACSEFF